MRMGKPACSPSCVPTTTATDAATNTKGWPIQEIKRANVRALHGESSTGRADVLTR